VNRRARWLVPAAVAAVVVAGGALAPGASADLPAKTPQEVLVLAQQADVEAFSGTVEVRTDLGIPTALLSGLEGEPSMGPGAGMDENRTVRVWRSGDDLARVSAATSMGEQTLVRNGDQLWFYDADEAVVRTGEVPAEPDGEAAPPWDTTDPTEVASRVLDALEPSTVVTAGEPVVVAGREAYRLVLDPQQPGTLVGQVTMAVDAQTGMALQVTVTAEGASEPAVDVAFSSIDVATPDAAVFDTSTPPGATVEPWDAPQKPDAAEPADSPEPQVVGEGWTTVVVLPPYEVPAEADSPEMALPAELLQPVPGGQVLSTALLSVMLADDGRVLVGAVTPEVLAAAAA
jgi:outer membrane lipoprotein-sorting protein